jgi:hypothetical protein
MVYTTASSPSDRQSLHTFNQRRLIATKSANIDTLSTSVAEPESELHHFSVAGGAVTRCGFSYGSGSNDSKSVLKGIVSRD